MHGVVPANHVPSLYDEPELLQVPAVLENPLPTIVNAPGFVKSGKPSALVSFTFKLYSSYTPTLVICEVPIVAVALDPTAGIDSGPAESLASACNKEFTFTSLP